MRLLPGNRYLRALVLLLFFSGILIFLGTVMVFRVVRVKSQPFLYEDPNRVPEHKVGLVLGTSKYAMSGNVNLYYKYRIDAVVELYNAGKIKYVLISGDNGTPEYNEPQTIKEDLIRRGIPAEKIFLDYAGFRTLDSVVRAWKIFGQNSFIVISQRFHNERAIYIARSYGIRAIGFNAQGVGRNYGFKTKIRERLARDKMVLDLLFNKQPKFLGEKIEIE
ncbi:vancomycin high temperature exclusion protein [bacterium]|nr:vancomycin high temperature exclusion protein [bacterium]